MLNSGRSQTSNKIKGLAMPPKDDSDTKYRKEPFVLKDIPREEADKKMEEYFKELEDQLKDVPKEVIEAGAQRVVDFLNGKIGWGEILNIRPDTMKQMVEIGYANFQSGRFDDAERYFKLLAILNPKNSYFRSMLGTILQKQKRFGEAIVQFTEALDLNPHDIVSLVNRGEIYMQHGWFGDAVADFRKAVKLDPKEEEKSTKRAHLLLNRIEEIKKRVLNAQKTKDEESKKDKKEKKTKGKK